MTPPAKSGWKRSSFAWLWTQSGKVALREGISPDRLVADIETLLRHNRVSVGDEPRRSSWLLGGDFSFQSWDMFTIFDRGWVWVEEGELHYCLRSLHAFVSASWLGAIMALVSMLAFGWAGIFVVLLPLSWVYGMHVLVASLRVPGFFQRMAATAK